MVDNLMTSHFDIIFLILSLLPADTLVRVQTVCRTWARVISLPDFIRKHCSDSAPIGALFIAGTDHNTFTHNLRKLISIEDGYRFPSSIAHIMLTGFVVVGNSSHGILCFSRTASASWVFVVGNPVTSSWCFVRFDIFSETFTLIKHYSVSTPKDLVLIYDLVISHYFKLVVKYVLTDRDENHHIQFNIYSSENCSWTSSHLFDYNHQNRLHFAWLQPCKIGGGSVCWIEQPAVLVGYEISIDTCWGTTLPPLSCQPESQNFSSHDNTIYCTIIDNFVTKVFQLEGKHSWLFKGACSTEQKVQFESHACAYDAARRALLVADTTSANLLPSHLSSSAVDNLCQFLMPTWSCTPIAH